ncbi:hypothetical protein NDI47_16995 [Microcoleus vaginatus GB1-A2]|uniref:hypothetical protein n=1 Tax=Microcoleus vaginatus TaxID=119532 RepID=UPI0016887660|nr:hypothetical protein [Microcoleus sp. FACHB-61]
MSFVVQIAAAVGLVGYFCFQNRQQAVNQFASQSSDAEADRIYPQYEVLATAFAVRDKLVEICSHHAIMRSETCFFYSCLPAATPLSLKKSGFDAPVRNS